MACYKCGGESVGACSRCGAGFCWSHGGRRKGDRADFCSRCRPGMSADDRRLWLGILLFFTAAWLLAMAPRLVVAAMHALGR